MNQNPQKSPKYKIAARQAIIDAGGLISNTRQRLLEGKIGQVV